MPCPSMPPWLGRGRSCKLLATCIPGRGPGAPAAAAAPPLQQLPFLHLRGRPVALLLCPGHATALGCCHITIASAATLPPRTAPLQAACLARCRPLQRTHGGATVALPLTALRLPPHTRSSNCLGPQRLHVYHLLNFVRISPSEVEQSPLTFPLSLPL
jgi:hypothetical protein